MHLFQTMNSYKNTNEIFKNTSSHKEHTKAGHVWNFFSDRKTAERK